MRGTFATKSSPDILGVRPAAVETEAMVPPVAMIKSFFTTARPPDISRTPASRTIVIAFGAEWLEN